MFVDRVKISVKGGRGGDGGNGAVAISASSFIVSGTGTAVSINITGGSGGQTGRRGGCHENNHGDGPLDKGSANDGDYGAAGVSATAFSNECVISDSSFIIVAQSGANGVVDTTLNQS